MILFTKYKKGNVVGLTSGVLNRYINNEMINNYHSCGSYMFVKAITEQLLVQTNASLNCVAAFQTPNGMNTHKIGKSQI